MTRGVSQKYPLSKQLRFTEVVMDEGDVLIFPMFTPHQTRTLTGETPLPSCAQTSPQELCRSWEMYGRRKLSSVIHVALAPGGISTSSATCFVGPVIVKMDFMATALQ